MTRSAVVLGSASPLGGALIQSALMARYDTIVSADTRDRLYVARVLAKQVLFDEKRFLFNVMDLANPFAGIDLDPLATADGVDIFYLNHYRDRSMGASALRGHNRIMFDRVLSIAAKLRTRSLNVVTDIGLIGDYPGRFSENWIDVGQTPFDEVDRSSLELELACFKEEHLSIHRIRVGFVLDPEGLGTFPEVWTPVSETVVGIAPILRKLPRFLRLPVAASKGALAPLTPSELAAEVMLKSSDTPRDGAYHAVVSPPPTIAQVLDVAGRKIGGAGLRPGLPVDQVAKLGRIPGLKELARRNADQIAAWWTPHRFCLSQNNLDVSRVEELIPDLQQRYSWPQLECRFN